MSVIRIEEYTTKNSEKVLKVILKPTKKFPEGKNFFFTDDNDITRELIESYTWGLSERNNNLYIVAKTSSLYEVRKTIKFHQEYAYRLLDYYPDYIDHINLLSIDNRDINLNVVNAKQNRLNTQSKGYTFSVKRSYFRPNYNLDGKTYHRGSYKSEPEALIATFNLRQEVYSDYNYNFLLDRREDIDIVDLELTGQISMEEAIYLHVKRYVSNNPWYVYRYNLFDYCQAHNIVIPDFILDKQGFMIDPITKSRLCPY